MPRDRRITSARLAPLALASAILVPCGAALGGAGGEPPEFVSGCGKLSFGPQGCVLFVDYTSGFSFFLQDTNGFSVGDTVFVEGPVDAELGGCFPILLPVIENTVIGPCPLPEDLNGDGIVNGADLGILLSEWGDCPFIFPCAADFDVDGDVDGADLGELLAAWS